MSGAVKKESVMEVNGVPQRFVLVTDYKNKFMHPSYASPEPAEAWARQARLMGFKVAVVQTAA